MNCAKKSFDNIDEARIALTKIVTRSERNIKPIRVYKCEYCKKYHLTSKTVDQYELNVRKRAEAIKKRNKRREEIFIKAESRHWETYFGYF